MKPNHAKSILTALSVIVLCMNVQGQMKSAVQFYDTTGATPTAKFGWSGSSADGQFFVNTPGDGDVMTIKNGNAAVKGTVTASRFSGDGSSLTNLHTTTVSAANVAGLHDSLGKKADTTYMINSAGTSGQVWKSDGSGRGIWGTDNSGNTVSGVADVPGLTDSLSKKADTTYMINGQGTAGQVWKSDGSGRGYWGTDSAGIGALPTGLVQALVYEPPVEVGTGSSVYKYFSPPTPIPGTLIGVLVYYRHNSIAWQSVPPAPSPSPTTQPALLLFNPNTAASEPSRVGVVLAESSGWSHYFRIIWLYINN